MRKRVNTFSVTASLLVDGEASRQASEPQALANDETVTMHMATGPRRLLQTVCGARFDGATHRRSMLLADVTCLPCFDQYRATLTPGGMSRKGPTDDQTRAGSDVIGITVNVPERLD